mmetsp:Transcript_1807/g.3474  ORF Transcript_1807/g.3474 Transcript_1807/m.3474 type:complete len:164 (+) Transcript_1807:42-533(+)
MFRTGLHQKEGYLRRKFPLESKWAFSWQANDGEDTVMRVAIGHVADHRPGEILLQSGDTQHWVKPHQLKRPSEVELVTSVRHDGHTSQHKLLLDQIRQLPAQRKAQEIFYSRASKTLLRDLGQLGRVLHGDVLTAVATKSWIKGLRFDFGATTLIEDVRNNTL